ncbi:metallophosphoesterase [Flavobacterium psychrotrophum]|uniref:metallophosphoesterase n=1 Tax=Flavobacterium psychrotrophum TaxID=2294119 RepID=UPI000E318891|nr:metallophosphoesterase [Flavobacterium psychrotrophum]
MKKFSLFVSALLLPLTSFSQQKNEHVQIAFLADVHLQDLYGTFKDTAYDTLINPLNRKPVLMRTMESQLHSTRIFNENYFAFLAALDDIAARGIKIVALPGDYTDDGQPIHLRGLQNILNQYNQKFGIQFYITTGNHDPVGPWDSPAGKDDFLGNGGKKQPVFSQQGIHTPTDKTELPIIISKDIATMGYESIITHLKDFGFYPNSQNKFWATPYSSYTYGNYNYSIALSESGYDNRHYEVAPGYTVPDATYITEPVDGLWLLAIDGNVYIPKKSADGNAKNPTNYTGASIGYNNVMTNKKHLISWVKQMVDEAKKRGKTLIAFSHYPMVEFNDGASAEITQLLGKGKWQMDRVPVDAVAQSFADAGIKIHFAGHMHINDTGIYKGSNGNTLVNVQTPSLAAYIPAYKLLTIKSEADWEVETITINDIPRFNELFGLYKTEYEFLKSINAKDIWDKSILKTKSYHDFTEYHLKELVRLRFIPDEWPKDFIAYFTNASGYDLLMTAVDSKVVKDVLKKHRLNTNDFKKWTGLDFIFDLYRLHSADCLALKDIGKKRLDHYKLIIELFTNNHNNNTQVIDKQLGLFYNIFSKLLNGDPAGHFMVNPENGNVTEIKD